MKLKSILNGYFIDIATKDDKIFWFEVWHPQEDNDFISDPDYLSIKDTYDNAIKYISLKCSKN